MQRKVGSRVGRHQPRLVREGFWGGFLQTPPRLALHTLFGFTIKVIIYDLISRDYKYLKEGFQHLNSFPVLGTCWNSEQF